MRRARSSETLLKGEQGREKENRQLHRCGREVKRSVLEGCENNERYVMLCSHQDHGSDEVESEE